MFEKYVDDSFLLDSLLVVDAWNLPEEMFCQALSNVLTEMHLETAYDIPNTSPYQALRF